MSALNSLFNRSTLGTRCKTCLNLSISRIKLLRNKREVQLMNMRKEIFQYLRTGQEAIARIRVEHVIREENILAAYEILELFCEFVLARVLILEAQRDCPLELQEAVASIIFASSRCSDLPELMHIRNLFSAKYGKEFISAVLELRPDSSVNRTIIEKLSIRAPPADLKLKVLKAISQEYNLEWDSSDTEAELNKKYEDLLDGSKPSLNQSTIIESCSPVSPPKDGSSVLTGVEDEKSRAPVASNSPTNSHSATGRSSSLDSKTDGINNRVDGLSVDEASCKSRNASDVLEKARAAIAAAERASAAARAAADLVKVKLPLKASDIYSSS